MKSKYKINCSNRDEMENIADRLIEQGFVVKAVEEMMPFQQHGICMPTYKVIFWDRQKDGKKTDRLFSLNKLSRRTLWKSDLHRTSALSESSVL